MAWQATLSLIFPVLRTLKPPEPEECDDARSKQDQITAALNSLCRIPDTQPQHFAVDRVQRVSEWLQFLYKSKPEPCDTWSSRARTYIILHNMGCTQFMDKFVQDGKTDIWLPYSVDTLPDYIQPESVREKFLYTQNFLLTSARELEDMSTDAFSDKVFPHIHLADSGDQHFMKIKTLGQGSFGYVKQHACKPVDKSANGFRVVEKVASCLSQRVYARKSVTRRRKNVAAQKYLAKELEDLKQLSHRHLVKVLGSYTDPQYIAYLMLPVAECNLEDFLTKPGGLSSGDRHDVRTFFGCLAGAVDYLHRSKIRHRDLSLRNILVHQGSVVISDFGSAYKWAGNGNQGSMTHDHHVPASSYYMAPEVAKKGPRSSSSDMWSLGIIFMEMTTLLVGRSLGQLRGTLNDNVRLNMEPFVWANPKVVTTWLEKLQISNKGPSHDNEPLEWIRDLLNPNPKSRPKAGTLMQDIHDTQSFNIFCCINCQPEYRERRYNNIDLSPIRASPEDTTDIMQSVASLLREEPPQPVVLSTHTQSTIHSWLADTEVHPQIPGSFDLDEEHVPTEFSNEFPRPPTQYALPALSSNISDLMLPLELGSTPAMNQFSPVQNLSTNSPHDSLLKATPQFARDTGLGFFEVDSPSSSDGGFRVLSDSSGSDTDSDITVTLSRDDHVYGETPTNLRKATLFLPQFTGEEHRVIQTLDALPEEHEDVAVGLCAPTNSSKADRLDAEDGPLLFDPSSSICDEVVELIKQDVNNIPTSTPSVSLLEEVHTPDIITDETRMEDGTGRSIDGTISYTTSARSISDSRGLEQLHGIDSSFEADDNTIKYPDLLDVSRMKDDDPPAGPFRDDEIPDGPSDSLVIIHRKNSGKKRSAHASMSRKDSLILNENSDASKAHLGTRSTGGDNEPEQPELDTELPSVAALPPGPATPIETRPNLVETQQSMPKSAMNSKTRLKKTSSSKVAFAPDPTPSTSRSVKKASAMKPGVSPSEYIQNTWDSASSVATSVMSAETKSLLKSLSLSRWLDRDHKLMEVFCSQGKAAAVRALLEKGCNPGKSGSRADRRPGPITIAVRGASQRHNKCVKALIHGGVDVNVENRSTGKTPLHLAIENPYFKGYEHLICALIDGGADTNKADHRGDYPIMKILHPNDTGPLEDHRRKALALLLREASTDVDITLPGTLNTPLHLAVRRKDAFAVGMLLYKNANVNAKNASGSSPLLVAANQFHNPMSKEQMDLLNILLSTEGICVNEKAGVKEQTALHYAIHAGVPWAVGKLLEHGADASCKDSEGRDARSLANICAEKWTPEDRKIIMHHLKISIPEHPAYDSARCYD